MDPLQNSSESISSVSDLKNEAINIPMPSENQNRKDHTMQWVIGGIIVYAIILYSIFGYWLFHQKKQTVIQPAEKQIPLIGNQTINEATSSSSSLFKDLNQTSTIIPLIRLERSLNSTSYSTTSSGMIAVPYIQNDAIIKDLVAFQMEKVIALGPKSWKADVREEDGGFKILHIYPSSPYVFPNPSIWVLDATTEAMDAINSLGLFWFPWIEVHRKELGLIPIKNESNLDVQQRITDHLVKLKKPLIGDLETTAYAFCDIDQHWADKKWTFLVIDILLPQSQHEMAETIANNFIQQYDLLHK